VAFPAWAVCSRNFSLAFLIDSGLTVKLEMLCPRLLAVSARINVAVRLLTLARSSSALNYVVTIGTKPRFLVLGEHAA